MAEGKKGFILYTDTQEIFNELSDAKAGKLIKHIFSYVNDENPISKDPIINLSFIPIKQYLKRDLKEWEQIKSKKAEAGRLGGLAKSSNASSGKKIIANLPVTDTVTVNDNVRDMNVLNAFKENVIETAKELSFTESIFIPFLEHWTERDFESKCYAWQVPETFVIKSRLKGWKKNQINNKVPDHDISKLF